MNRFTRAKPGGHRMTPLLMALVLVLAGALGAAAVPRGAYAAQPSESACRSQPSSATCNGTTAAATRRGSVRAVATARNPARRQALDRAAEQPQSGPGGGRSQQHGGDGQRPVGGECEVRRRHPEQWDRHDGGQRSSRHQQERHPHRDTHPAQPGMWHGHLPQRLHRLDSGGPAAAGPPERSAPSPPRRAQPPRRPAAEPAGRERAARTGMPASHRGWAPPPRSTGTTRGHPRPGSVPGRPAGPRRARPCRCPPRPHHPPAVPYRTDRPAGSPPAVEAG